MPTDNTPLWSRRQLEQTLWQFAVAAITAYAAMPADQPLINRILTAIVAGLVGAGLIVTGAKLLPSKQS